MKRTAIISMFVIGLMESAFTQNNGENLLKFNAYADVYYQRDFNNPISNTRPDFVYSHSRNNEISLNLALLGLSYQAEKIRSNLSVGAGSYMNANYAAEEGVLKNIYEGNIGVRLSPKHELWLDVGVLPSHIGSESAIGTDCFTLTRSMMAENSPYFETGARLSFTSANDRWDMALLVLNGWQRIQRPEGNSAPAFGHQLTFRPTDRVTFNSSSYIGNDMPDTQCQMRYFHNFYSKFDLNEKFALLANFDVGVQQKEKSADKKYNTWYGAALIAKYEPTSEIGIALRGEYYHDKNSTMIISDTAHGFQASGASVNIDYRISSNLMWRSEIKSLFGKDAYFLDRGDRRNKSNTTLVTSLNVHF